MLASTSKRKQIDILYIIYSVKHLVEAIFYLFYLAL